MFMCTCIYCASETRVLMYDTLGFFLLSPVWVLPLAGNLSKNEDMNRSFRVLSSLPSSFLFLDLYLYYAGLGAPIDYGSGVEWVGGLLNEYPGSIVHMY